MVNKNEEYDFEVITLVILPALQTTRLKTRLLCWRRVNLETCGSHRVLSAFNGH